MRKLLLTLMLLSAALLLPPHAKAQFIVVGQGCGASGLSGIANDGTPVVCKGSPLVWTAVGGGSGGGGPAASLFNVKTFGAVGNAQQSVNGTATSTTAFTCSDCAFTQADVGKNIACSAVGVTDVSNNTKIQSVTNGTTIILSQAGLANTGCTVTWGTPDDAAIAAAITPFLAAIKSLSGAGNTGVMSVSPVLYFPTGAYYFASAMPRILNPAGAFSGGKIQGDGKELSKLYFTTGITATNAVIEISSNQSNFYINDMTIDGMQGAFTAGFQTAVLLSSSNTYLNNIIVQNFSTIGGILAAGPQVLGYNVSTVGNNGIGFRCQQCTGELRGGIQSNNGGANLSIESAKGSTGSSGFRLYGSLIDECGNLTACTQIINSSDVWFMGPALFGNPSGKCLLIDANSFLHWEGGICGPFGGDNNTNGVSIAAGGTLQASDVRFISSGTGKCVTNSGVFNDNGGNSCESAFVVVSGASAGTTATLTVTTAGANVNANCTIGDSLLVEGTGGGNAGYNGYFKAGITGVTATTITYTTQGSNIGAIGAGGAAHCRNLQQYSGTLPVALLNNPIPNTCHYTITPIANATAVTLCNWSTGTATNITRIRASSQVTTTCATAPIITISNGTVSQTLTLTSGQSSWDSSVDASSGVGTTIFKPNTTITVKYDVAQLSSCATPATNLAISYNITPILSN